MKAHEYTMLWVLLNRFHHGSIEAVIEPLSPEEAKEMLSYKNSSQQVAAAFVEPTDLIQKVHSSWLSKEIEKNPKELAKLLATVLPAKRAFFLQKTKEHDQPSHGPTKQLSKPVKLFLLRQLYHQLGAEAVLPLAYLPPSPLLPLVEWNKKELVELIDFLSLQDLAEALRFTVDKNKINAVYQKLSAKKLNYLKICLHQKDKLQLPLLNLDRWHTNSAKLTLLLHRRGLLRFAKVLAGQHSDLIWHITHILDEGRGTFIKKHCSKETIAGITPYLIQQLANLMNLLKKVVK